MSAIAVYHPLCKRTHELLPPVVHTSQGRVANVGYYIGWVRCGGVTLHVYAPQPRIGGAAFTF